MDPFLTVYRKDFVAKPIQLTPPFKTEQEFQDPLQEGFKKYLVLKGDKSTFSDREELANDFLERLSKNNSHLVDTYYKEPLDKRTLERNATLNGKSVYQVDYCNLDEDDDSGSKQESDSLKSKEKIVLPDDWDIPLTTHRTAYRDPSKLVTSALSSSTPFRPHENLVCDEKLRKILNVKTECTEYQAKIGKLGDVIIEDEMHGKVVHLKCKDQRRR